MSGKRSPETTIVLALAVAVLVAGGCGDAASSYRSVLEDQIRAFTDMERILATVQDAKGMAAAQEKLTELQGRSEAIAARGRKLPTPMPPEVGEQLAKEAAALKRAFAGVDDQRRRIAALPGGGEFLESLGPGTLNRGVGREPVGN